MNERFVKHATFVVERTYAASPAKVYRLGRSGCQSKVVSQPDIFEFHVGGREYSSGGPPEGPVFTFDACYQEIVPEERIVYSYTLDSDDKRISVSLTTVELIPTEDGTKLVFTEQGHSSTGMIRLKCVSMGRMRCLMHLERHSNSG